VTACAGCEGLTRLCFRCCNVVDTDLANIRKLTALRYLDISYTRVGPAGVAALAPLAPTLRVLKAVEALNDEALAHVAALTGLEELEMGEDERCKARISDAGLAQLVALPSLQVSPWLHSLHIAMRTCLFLRGDSCYAASS
jgi:hypothetical protein